MLDAIPRRLFTLSLGSLLQAGERTFQLLQGKGLGSRSLRSEVRAAGRFLTPGAVVFDVGANRGMYTRELLRRSSGVIGQIHLFEPSKAHFDRLKNIADPRVIVNYIGLGAKKETRQLYSDSIGSGLSSLYKRNLAHKGISLSHSEEVQISTVDDYVQANNIERIALLKLDVEGHELSVLQGARESLAARVSTVQFEFGGCNLDSRTYFRDFWDLFTSFRFQLAVLSPIFGLLRIERYTEALECFTTTNYFAYRDAGRDASTD